MIGHLLGGTIWVVLRYLGIRVWEGDCLVVGGTLTSHAAPEFLDHHTSRSCRTRTRRKPAAGRTPPIRLPLTRAEDEEDESSPTC